MAKQMSLQKSLGRTAKTSGGLGRTGEHRQQQHCRTRCGEQQEGLVDTGKDWWTQATTTLQNTLQGTTGRAGGHRQGLVDTGNSSQ